MVKGTKWKGRLIALAIIAVIVTGIGIGIYFLTRDTIDNYNESVVTKGDITTYTTYSGNVVMAKYNATVSVGGEIESILPDDTIITAEKIAEDGGSVLVAKVKTGVDTFTEYRTTIPGRVARHDFKVGDKVVKDNIIATVYDYHKVTNISIKQPESKYTYMRQLYLNDVDTDITVTFNMEKSAGKKLTAVGKIKSIPATAASGSFSYAIQIKTTEDHKMIVEGTTLQIRIVETQAKDILCLPRTAIQTDVTGKAYVQVLEGEKLAIKYVTLGLSDSSKVQIRTGLEEGDKVFTPKPSEKKGLIASLF